ncbi:MAG TPA: hypothetical protein VF337_04095 [Candidatus Limnocylindrales bacterium]
MARAFAGRPRMGADVLLTATASVAVATGPKGEILQRLRGIIAAAAVGVPLIVFLHLWLHAPIEFAVIIAVVLGTAIFAIVATRSDSHDEAADIAWREVAPDLPPVSDRIALERDQASMPGPGKPRAAGKRRPPNEITSQGAGPK